MRIWNNYIKNKFNNKKCILKIEVVKLTDLCVGAKVLHDYYEYNLIIRKDQIVKKNSFYLEINSFK